MHQSHLGIFARVRNCIEKMFSLQDKKNLDYRLTLVKHTHRFGDLTSKLLNKPYFEEGEGHTLCQSHYEGKGGAVGVDDGRVVCHDVGDPAL